MRLGRAKNPVKCLFDADIISALMKGRAPQALQNRLEAASGDSQAISSVTVFEVRSERERGGKPIASAVPLLTL